MARREAGKRLLIGVVYVPIYYFVLYPLVIALGIVVALVDISWTLLTGRSLRVKPTWASDSWESISQPITWIFSGEQRDKPGWVP